MFANGGLMLELCLNFQTQRFHGHNNDTTTVFSAKEVRHSNGNGPVRLWALGERTLAAPEFSSIFAGNFAGKCAATGYIAGRRPNSRRPKFFPTDQRNIFLLRCPILILIITLT
jgi:hypothetical protein